MHIVVVGINHRSAPIDIRERLAFSQEGLPQVLERLRADVSVPEAAVLSTCNRVEVYVAAPALNGTIDRLQDFLSRHGRVDRAILAPRFYSYTQPLSVQHLFSVASGLDSMVIGEHEILCQVKHAYERARVLGATGKTLNVLFQRAINAAKEVRTQTTIGSGSASVGSIAVDLAERIFGEMNGRAVLLVGAGPMSELVLRRLVDRGLKQVRLLNRSIERAERLAKAYGGVAMHLARLEEELVGADIVITSLGSGAHVLDKRKIARAMHQRRQRPLCLIDLGVPRNLDPAAASLENVYLFNVDDLQGLVERFLYQRQAAMEKSRQIVDQKAGRFLSWLTETFTQEALPESSGPPEK